MSRDTISLRYLLRLMEVLEENGEMTVTNLAMLSRLNHTRCTELVEQLQSADHVDIRILGRRRYVRLTQKGSMYAAKLREVGELSPIVSDKTYVHFVRTKC
jgi:predicted transcriptional regulator